MASSSSAIDSSEYNYDVFLSFRGQDTPYYYFTSHLCKALSDLNIKVFIEHDIKRGNEITKAVERVIEGAKMSIIVFSKNYADSTFCLDELLAIMECREFTAQIVLPIFYKVEPSEETYREAFARHEREKISQEMKVEKWKAAFRKALELPGCIIVDEKSDDVKIIGKISKLVSEKLCYSIPKEELVYTSMVGHTAEENFKRIWEYLMKDEFSRVGVYGMGGVGKTAIATRIYDQLLATDISFSFVFWVSVSKNSSIYDMQSKIARVINLDLSKNVVLWDRAVKLIERLKTEKFLLILDGVCEAFEIEGVGIPHLVGRQKLLLTSRSRRVCEIMKCQPIEVEPLSKIEALDLFMKECQINDFSDCRDIVGSIVKECGGVALAIIVVARRMRGVDEIWKWRDILQKLQESPEGENLGIEEKVFKALKLSYDLLPNDRYRQCFLYCSLFPEGHEFEREDLINYWIGEGLIEELDCRQAEVDEGNVILDELTDSSLLNDHFHGFIKMHNVIREMARVNVTVGLQFEDPLESVQVINETSVFGNLNSARHRQKTIVLQDSKMKLETSFFSNMTRLNVLHISMKREREIPEFYLKNIRLLIIRYCPKVRRIPSLVGLENLRHLEISGNEMLREVFEGIERLVNLRVLDISNNRRLKVSFPIGAIEKLSHLQTLDLIGSRIEVEPEAVISLEKVEIVRIQFYDLHKLNCYVKSGHWGSLLDYQIHYRGHSLEFLHFDDYRSFFCVSKNPTFAHLQTISIREYQGMYIFTAELAQQLLHNVQELVIRDCNSLMEIIESEEDINHPTILLPNLKILELFNLPILRSIFRGIMECPSLELIQIGKCDKVERLPFFINNKQNPTIKLGGLFGKSVSRRWWESLQWDDPNVKSIYQPIFDTESESETSKRKRVDETIFDSQSEHDSEYESEVDLEIS